MTNFKMQQKRIPTNEEGIFYKSIINENGKEVDKAYIIRYRENDTVQFSTSFDIYSYIYLMILFEYYFLVQYLPCN